MLILLPAKRRGKKLRDVASTTPTPPAPLVLVYADYDPNTNKLTLQFDRAMNFAGIDELVIHVNDPVTNFVMLEATGLPEAQSEDVMVLDMTSIGPSSGSTVTLDAGAGNGIVAVDNGGAWAGADNVELPVG